jgi:hypothetical protein
MALISGELGPLFSYDEEEPEEEEEKIDGEEKKDPEEKKTE